MTQFSSKTLFLIDGCGAVISALMLGLLLPNLDSWFGMPENVLFKLAFMAAVLALWSWSMFILKLSPALPYLRLTAVFNLTYITITMAFLYTWKEILQALDWVYFISECILVIVLVKMEWGYKSKDSQG